MQTFDCGDAVHEEHVTKWLREWIWGKPLERQPETWIAVDEDANRVAGYGTWEHVNAFGTTSMPVHIEIAWFGIDRDYQGVCDENGDKVADRIYAAVEDKALAHSDSTPDMPFTLVVHVDNDRGRKFWLRQGYTLIGDPKLQIEKNLYERMVR